MRITYEGEPGFGVTAKDLILGTIGQISAAGAVGHAIEYAGAPIEALTIEGRMTICNMSIEAGARAGMIAPDDVTFSYLEGRPAAPSDFEAAVERWRSLPTDPGATFDTEVTVDASALVPQVTWGTNPGQVVPVTGRVPDPAELDAPADRESAERALAYMALEPGTAIEDIAVDRVFIGSCTNSRIEDLRVAAAMVRGRQVAGTVDAMVVPGSQQVKAQAEQEGLDEVFRAAGFDWREAGCSMCLGMNPDILQPGERCASTSNRNFEGRQGRGGRTHLVSPRWPRPRPSPATSSTSATGTARRCRGDGMSAARGRLAAAARSREAFVEDRRALIPLIDGQDELVRRLITRGGRRVTPLPRPRARAAARFAELVMETHPEATGVLVDFSEPMAAAATRAPGASRGRWEYVQADLSGPVGRGAAGRRATTRSCRPSASTTCLTSASARCTHRPTSCSSRAGCS